MKIPKFAYVRITIVIQYIRLTRVQWKCFHFQWSELELYCKKERGPWTCESKGVNIVKDAHQWQYCEPNQVVWRCLWAFKGTAHLKQHSY